MTFVNVVDDHKDDHDYNGNDRDKYDTRLDRECEYFVPKPCYFHVDDMMIKTLIQLLLLVRSMGSLYLGLLPMATTLIVGYVITWSVMNDSVGSFVSPLTSIILHLPSTWLL